MKNDKMRGLPSILSLFRNEFSKFNNTAAHMLGSIYHMTLKLVRNAFFGVKMSSYCHLFSNVILDAMDVVPKLTCADPENFVRGGPTLFFMRGG